jgi:hypothetical protein
MEDKNIKYLLNSYFKQAPVVCLVSSTRMFILSLQKKLDL